MHLLHSHVVLSVAELGKEVTKYISSGALVPDELIISLMSKEMKTVGPKWLLDGEG